jgi:hypothetical protein
MHQQFLSLIADYAETGLESDTLVDSWCAEHPLDESGWVALAEYIGSQYLEGHIHYSVANGLMNELMPIAGWHTAPKRFWEYYIAFEDGEILVDPDEQVKKAVWAVANRNAA